MSDEPRRRSTRKTKASAKVNKIQLSLRRSNGTSKRMVDPADAKVGQTQHSPAKKSKNSTRDLRQRTSSNTSQSTSRSVQSTESASRSVSTEDTERDCRPSSHQQRSQREDPEESSSGASSSADEDDVHDRPKHTLKPPRFDGKKSFETFMAQFSNCAQHNRWNRAEKLAYLRNSLDSEAANVLWDYGADVTDSLSGLTKILESRFGGKATAEKHRIELRHRRRRKDETLQSLHSDIRRLAALAYPDVQPQTRDVITGDYFLDALGNPDLALKVRERQPEDLDAALRVALQLEVWEADAMRSKEGPKLEREGKRIREISNRKPDGGAFQKRMEEKMEAKFAEFEGRIPVTSSNGGFQGNYRSSGSIRHTAPNSYGGARPQNGRFPLNSRGQNAASYGVPWVRVLTIRVRMPDHR